MNRRWILLVVLVCTVLTFAPVRAHHGGAAWDRSAQVSIKGTVTKYIFANPHVYILFDEKDEKGQVVQWNCESADVAMLVRQGWTRTTVKPGDEVTFVGYKAKNGSKVMVLSKLILANGKEIEAKSIAQ
jgi:hypothetical protein